ncbi:MAG TPA: hypothetical protein VF629_10400 [Hymenobacter sp.]|uniref:hypothetical protein n=1 Tax=Hymenobacter sp. TaxID=1898978 RepID=UPI002ED7B493
MPRLLRFSLLLAAVGLVFAGPAAATHLQGGDLTYASLGNNRYRVTLHLYRDCSGIVPGTFTLEGRNGSCNSAPSVSAVLTLVGTPVAARQYCATLSGACNSGLTNSEMYTYAADITLPPAARWVLSTSQNARPNTTNLATSGDLYLEATLNNLVPAAGTTGQVLVNTSPVVSALPAFFVPVHQMTTLSNSGYDADGDSLSYSLETPLLACNMPVSYTAYPQTNPTVITTNPLCVFQGPTYSAYSTALPIIVDHDTLGACPARTAGTPRFSFDTRTGALTMQPGRYLPTNTTLGDNKYAAAVKISEYRRLNGSYVLVGTMRRELYFMVYDCGTNLMPRFAPAATVEVGTRSTVQPTGQIITTLPGEPVSVVVTATDANATQVPIFTLDYSSGTATTLLNLGAGRARVTFTPSLTMPDGLYRVAVTAEDDACPIKGLDSQVLTFRVRRTALAARPSTALRVAAFPNPFTDHVRFQLAAAGVQTLTICDYLGRTVATVRSQADGSVRWLPAAGLPTGLYLARGAQGTQPVRLLRQAAR